MTTEGPRRVASRDEAVSRRAGRAALLEGTFRRGMPSFVAMLLVIGVLFVFNLSTLRLLWLFEASKENDLARQLVAVGRTILRDLRRPALPAILELLAGASEENAAQALENFAETAAYGRLADELAEVQRANDLRELVLLTPHGLVVAEGTRREAPGTAYVFRETDREPLARAAQGAVAAMRLYPIGDTYYKRVYLPIVSDGRVVGILGLSASADYFASLRELQRRVHFQMALSSVLLGLLVFFLYRFLAYLLEAEKRALHLARVEAMGALAGGLAHELRNPLSIMRMLCEEILREQPPQTRAAENARELIGEIERLNSLVSHFLSLSKPPEQGQSDPVALDREIEQVAELVRKSGSGTLRLHVEMASRPVLVAADPRALRQVLLNLLLNAREAVEAAGGGEVTLTLTERRGMAELHVRDTGVGMTPEVLARAFDPFFTTKPTGSGLGLAITRSIVENLGGNIAVQSVPGQGTDVCVRLPIAEPLRAGCGR